MTIETIEKVKEAIAKDLNSEKAVKKRELLQTLEEAENRFFDEVMRKQQGPGEESEGGDRDVYRRTSR